MPWQDYRRALKNLLIYQGVTLMVFILAGLGLRVWLRPSAVPTMSGGLEKWVRVGGGEICGLWEMDLGIARSLLHQGVPLLKKHNQPQTVYGRPRGFFRAFTDLSSDVDLISPQSLLKRQILPFGQFEAPQARRPMYGLPIPPIDTVPPQGEIRIQRDWGDSPLIAIYHTHSSESYLPDQGTDRTKGTPGGVVEVGEELARCLWDVYGIPVVHSQTIHDYPAWRLSYVNAGETAENLVKSYPRLQMVIDLHRDAARGGEKMANYTVSSGGEPIARVMMIVGSDKLGLPHPYWRENLHFTQEFNGLMEELYPGLSRGVRLREDGRWNQHVHPHAVILEVGEVHNSEGEAKASAVRLARVIYEMLVRAEKNGKKQASNRVP